jgi:Zn-dependent M28 family amino/carboxypeptidase
LFRIVQYSIYVLLLLCVSCAKQQQSSHSAVRYAFSADSAYHYIAQQVAFGARVPGTEEHAACGDWLVKKLAQYGAQVQSQYGTMPNYAGEEQALRNIVAYLEGNTQHAILLCAHWDSRPWSDEEPLYENRFAPVIGANDGASGVGVILEIVRQLSIRKAQGEYIPSVQIILFDCEDMGTPTHYTGKEREHTWCLGSQYWAKELKIQNSKFKIQYGILLDMVGDPSATFPREYFSMTHAGNYVEQLWRTAAQLGYGRYFVNHAAYPITDDHYYVNTIAGIPCVDIIDYKPQNGTGFAEWWHTQQDDMRNINRQTLKAVGETVITTICSR